MAKIENDAEEIKKLKEIEKQKIEEIKKEKREKTINDLKER